MAVTLSAEETLNLRRKLPTCQKSLTNVVTNGMYQVHLSTDGNQTYKLTTEVMMGATCIRKHKFKYSANTAMEAPWN